ncbi:MAG: 6,7-dimethyl-8-ribityllumazine synthase [Planctomycetes bacterium]|nr:6,7-dimethyl-8-ribityllumazine synthase [Planctomycetota bacterium]
MSRTYEGGRSGKGKKFAIVVSRFNEFITNRLLEGATDALVRQEVAESDIEIAWVPGSFEIPLAARRMAESGRFAAVVCLGAVIRGQTTHFDYVAGECARGISQVAAATGIPAIFGVITADNLEQAIDRAGARQGNRGAEAALAAIEMASLLAQLPAAEGRAPARTP